MIKNKDELMEIFEDIKRRDIFNNGELMAILSFIDEIDFRGFLL